MNLKTHLSDIRDEFLNSLSKNKEQMVQGVLNSVKRLELLLKTETFDFEVNHIKKINWADLPITKYALDQEKKRWENLDLKQKDFIQTTKITFERLFTYWEEDDLCEMQGQYFYFKDNRSNKVFCESEFGKIRDFGKNISFEQAEIATITHLKSKKIINSANENRLI
jgi:hypothetical protein